MVAEIWASVISSFVDQLVALIEDGVCTPEYAILLNIGIIVVC